MGGVLGRQESSKRSSSHGSKLETKMVESMRQRAAHGTSVKSFNTIIMKFPKIDEGLRKCKAIFEQFDEDSNGEIDKEELKNCFHKLEISFTEEEISDLFEACELCPVLPPTSRARPPDSHFFLFFLRFPVTPGCTCSDRTVQAVNPNKFRCAFTDSLGNICGHFSCARGKFELDSTTGLSWTFGQYNRFEMNSTFIPICCIYKCVVFRAVQS